jgi:hypothetical protein
MSQNAQVVGNNIQDLAFVSRKLQSNREYFEQKGYMKRLSSDRSAFLKSQSGNRNVRAKLNYTVKSNTELYCKEQY